MDHLCCLPEVSLTGNGSFTLALTALGLKNLRQAAFFLRDMPYGYPENRDLLRALEEKHGTCVHKHGILASAAREIGFPLIKVIGIYGMNASVVAEIEPLLHRFHVPALPAVHCFLAYGPYRFDLTEGNCNGKQTALDSYYEIHPVAPDISADQEHALWLDFIIERWKNFFPAPHPTLGELQELQRLCHGQLKINQSCSLIKRTEI